MRGGEAAHIQEDADGVPPADGVPIALQVVCEGLRVALHMHGVHHALLIPTLAPALQDGVCSTSPPQ